MELPLAARRGLGRTAATSTAVTAVAVLLGGLLGAGGATPQAASSDQGPRVEAEPGVVVVPADDRPIVVISTLTSPGALSRGGRLVTAATGGTRLFEVSATGGNDLPEAARRAYERAARRIEDTRPGCGLPWGVLAGIGRVESDHGRYGGSRLGVDGVSEPPIIGIALDGVGPVAAIPDTDDGRLDGDRVWDRAVGPMQFIPSTWATAKADGDGDGVADPHDLDDASLAAAGYLCPAGGGAIGGEEGIRRALFSYNHDDYYVDLVYAFGVGYQTGVFDLPPPPVEPEPEPTEEPVPGPATDAPDAGAGPSSPPPRDPKEPRPPKPPTPQPQPDDPPRDPRPPKPPTPTPTPQPQQPAPTPTPPALVLASTAGPWTACGGGWCLSGAPLDLGPGGHLAATAAADLDGDGTTGTNRAELDGLVGTTVTIQVRRGSAVVYTVNGAGYRNADGSFAT
jgi:hypothetical protein